MPAWLLYVVVGGIAYWILSKRSPTPQLVPGSYARPAAQPPAGQGGGTGLPSIQLPNLPPGLVAIAPGTTSVYVRPGDSVVIHGPRTRDKYLPGLGVQKTGLYDVAIALLARYGLTLEPRAGRAGLASPDATFEQMQADLLPGPTASEAFLVGRTRLRSGATQVALVPTTLDPEVHVVAIRKT